MKREPRLRLKRIWFISMVIAGAMTIIVGSAALAQQLSQVHVTLATKLAELLLAVPFVPWLAKAIPTGNSPLLLPWGLVITCAMVIPLAFCAWRFHRHRERFAEEERARDLRDI